MSYIKINKNNLYHNLDLLSKRLGSKDKLAVVLKDNAYGHGLVLIAKLISEYGIKRVIVKDESEAIKIRELFEDIIILNPNFTAYYDNFSLVISSHIQLKRVKDQKIHLKFDTGMHRNGFDIQKIDTTKLNLVGIMTHFRSADEIGSEQFWQQQNWKKIKDIYKDSKAFFHSGNSATVLRLNSYEDDFARCGIAVYGYHHMDRSFGEFDLRPVLTLYAQKLSSRELKKGDRVGYGGVGLIDRDMVVSTYDVGYADGFFRYDGMDEFCIDSKRVIGRISMDSISIEGDSDKVAIIKDAKELSKRFNTISYDILAKLNPLIKRDIDGG
jgi:alanine racemase